MTLNIILEFYNNKIIIKKINDIKFSCQFTIFLINKLLKNGFVRILTN